MLDVEIIFYNFTLMEYWSTGRFEFEILIGNVRNYVITVYCMYNYLKSCKRSSYSKHIHPISDVSCVQVEGED